jgi:excisionase family DNA binding protein
LSLHNSRIIIQRRCEYCGKLFTTQTTITRFCSSQCNSRFHKAEIRNEKIEKSNRETIVRMLYAKQLMLDKEILTVKDVAKILGSSKVAVYGMVSSGRLKAINLSIRKIRILRSDVLEMLGLPGLIVVPKIKEKKSKVKVPNDSVILKDGYKINEIIPAFGKSRDALYIYLKRNKIPREKVGKEIVLSKDAVDELYRRFKAPKYGGLVKEIDANLKLSKKALKIRECYSIEECVKMFGKSRDLLYGIFNRRKVPRIREGRNVYVLKKVVDKIFLNLKRVRIVSKVTLRQKAISKGRNTLYLDIYPPIPHPDTGILTRKYYLKIYVYAKPATGLEREHNKAMIQLAEYIRAKRQIAVQHFRFNFLSQDALKRDFTNFYKQKE